MNSKELSASTPSSSSSSVNANTKSVARHRRNSLLIAAKWLFAISLIALLIYSGKLSPAHVIKFFKEPVLAFFGFVVMVLVALGGFYRWRVLLKALGFEIRYFQALRLGMTGLFFSAVIPGTVGGDFVKAVYVAKLYPEAKTRSISTIVLDRISGLIGILLLGGLASAVALLTDLFSDLGGARSEVVKAFTFLLVIVSAFLLLALAVYPWIAQRLPTSLPQLFLRIPGSRVFQELYVVAHDFKERPFVIWYVVAMSMVFHSMSISVLALVAYIVYGVPPWGQIEAASFVLATVLGNCAISIPISPMGLGVGQIAFSEIFYAVGAPNFEFGTGIITNFQILQLTLALCGVFFFLSYKGKKTKNDLGEIGT
jgi:uncharacterized membrane protein YbhN (UPF0104 family)